MKRKYKIKVKENDKIICRLVQVSYNNNIKDFKHYGMFIVKNNLPTIKNDEIQLIKKKGEKIKGKRKSMPPPQDESLPKKILLTKIKVKTPENLIERNFPELKLVIRQFHRRVTSCKGGCNKPITDNDDCFFKHECVVKTLSQTEPYKL